jgi:hypothetical protein
MIQLASSIWGITACLNLPQRGPNATNIKSRGKHGHEKSLILLFVNSANGALSMALKGNTVLSRFPRA